MRYYAPWAVIAQLYFSQARSYIAVGSDICLKQVILLTVFAVVDFIAMESPKSINPPKSVKK